MSFKPSTVYKIVDRAAWVEACAREKFTGSPDDLRDGFIHLSTSHQVSGTLARHFAGRNDLVLVAFATNSLCDKLKWEPSRGGEDFPHLYTPLPTAQALWVREIARDETGQHILPPDLS